MTDTTVKTKRKRTAAEKTARKRRRLEYEFVFMNGKQKRIKRPLTIDGMDADEFIRQNAGQAAGTRNRVRPERMKDGDTI